MRRRRPLTAVIGFGLEANAFAPPTSAARFEEGWRLEGQPLAGFLDDPAQCGFARALRSLGPHEIAPLFIRHAPPGGPVVDADLPALDARIDAALAGMRPDAVFVFGHGAAASASGDDLDARWLRRIRRAAGPQARIVAELDFHANLSAAALGEVDALVGYRTNPHVDIAARAGRAAELTDALLGGACLHCAAVRLPLLTPQVCQLTTPGEPLEPLMREADALEVELGLADVSIFPGFALGDRPEGGFWITALAREPHAARSAVLKLGEHAWALREALCTRRLLTLDAAVRLARAATRPIVLADVADNPGGGGGGDTPFLLEALASADVRGAALGIVCDPALVADALTWPEDAPRVARFNRAPRSAFAAPFEAQAMRLWRGEARFTDTRGMAAGRAFDLGPAVRVAVGGVEVCVASRPSQPFSPDAFSAFGVDVDRVKVFAVKSRGHFRAGFSGLVEARDMHEVALPGLTTPDLASLPWRRRARPAYPLEPGAVWDRRVLAFAPRTLEDAAHA